ncbi:hypothetical protein [Tepidibacillus fermentans]|uniref:Uncharacterized protein n=1 Tax=Tepidibacillus fermentans TaxID=1281767 RepID=A0A4R3KKK7_9BACI|nr:hypothetical protein [Tepidibacillus fermentans]TCS84010.1 hypothetical protein EDD72_10250 [Tepidibacillus fermentans]
MSIEPLLSYIVVHKVTGKKIRTLIESRTGETFTYDFGDTIYDYKSNSYVTVTQDGTTISMYDYKSGKHFSIQSKSPGIFMAYQFENDDYYEIRVQNKLVLITNKKKGTTKVYYYHQ